jgi:hypothetical protein
LHPPGRSLEQTHAEHVLDPLDGAGQSRLRRLQERGRGDEAAILGDREHGQQLARPEIGDVREIHDHSCPNRK